MCNASKKSSEQSSFNFEIILFEVFFRKNEKKHTFVFSIQKILGLMSFDVNFLKSVGRNSKNTLLGLQ